MLSNNGCPECEERLDEGIILVLISEAQGAYLEAQGAYLEAQGAHIELITIGGKAHASKSWIARKRTTNLT